MKTLLIITATFLVFFSCTKKENSPLVGKWKLTEELIDIGDGKGGFQPAQSQQTIVFYNNGTYKSTVNLCPTLAGVKGSKGKYSTMENKIVPENCQDEGRNITFELVGQELIINLLCIEPCKQKYMRMDSPTLTEE